MPTGSLASAECSRRSASSWRVSSSCALGRGVGGGKPGCDSSACNSSMSSAARRKSCAFCTSSRTEPAERSSSFAEASLSPPAAFTAAASSAG